MSFQCSLENSQNYRYRKPNKSILVIIFHLLDFTWNKNKSSLILGSSSAHTSTSYGLAPIFKKAISMTQMPASEPPAVPVKDHIVSQEAMLLGFLAENTLPFTMAPKLIELTKAMRADKTALSNLSISRVTASYKMRFGLAKAIADQLSEELQNTYFLLNIDKATNDATHKKILTILVSFFSYEKGETVVRHYALISLESVTSSILFDCVTEIFQSTNLPWNSLMSVLLVVMSCEGTNLDWK